MRIAAESCDGHVQIAVLDNVIGIDPVYREKIFEPFNRLHGRDIPETGLGLAICARLVKRYGGRIWVESNEEGGATFRFALSEYRTVNA